MTAIPLSSVLPLRSSADWGAYEQVETLPWVYGRVRITPVQYNRERTQWLCADHPIGGVDAVTRDDTNTRAWSWRTEIDATGRAVSLLELGEPLADGESLAAELRGRLHPDTGALITSPADVLWSILHELCGIQVQAADLDPFRADCEALEITLNGVLSDRAQTVRSAVTALLGSIGATFSASMPGLALLLPGSERRRWSGLDASALDTPTAQAVATDLVTVLRVLYDRDWAARRHRRALQIEAPEAIERFGRLEAELDAGWLRDSRQALALAERRLGYQARPRWVLRAGVSRRQSDIRAGDDIELSHPCLPAGGRWLVSDVELDLADGSARVRAETPVGAVPRLALTRLAAAWDPLPPSGAAVQYEDGVATIELRDPLGQPLAGARVTFDGRLTATSDSAGRVQFPASRGVHRLYIEPPGREPLETEITV